MESDREPVTALRYVPALDGLRGLSVIAVLCYHQHRLSGGTDWAIGGYLGVSAFFTLSGYLITSLLLAEFDRLGTIRLVTFWARRLRRLLPAALVALVVCLSSAALFLPGEYSVGLRDDALGTLVYATNWRFLVGGTSYAEVNGASSPVLHFWSLAIEEQFYLVWPAVVAALLRWRSRRAVGWAAAVAIVGSAVTSAALNHAGASLDHLYLATYTRAAELGVGSLIAVARPLYRHVGRPTRFPWLGPLAGLSARGGVMSWTCDL